MNAHGECKSLKWEESDILQISGSTKITKAEVTYGISGEIAGTVDVQYLMYYRYFDKTDQHRSDAEYVGLLHFSGEVQGKQGAFVLEDRGVFSSGCVTSSMKIMSGSGTAGLSGIEGSGKYTVDGNGFTMDLDYQM